MVRGVTKQVRLAAQTLALCSLFGCGGGDDSAQQAATTTPTTGTTSTSTTASGAGGGSAGNSVAGSGTAGSGGKGGGGDASGSAGTSSTGAAGQIGGASMTGGAGGMTPEGGRPDASPSASCPAGAVFCEDFEQGKTSQWFLTNGMFGVSSDGSQVLRVDAGNGSASVGYSIPTGWGDQTVEGRFKVTIDASAASYRVGIGARCSNCYIAAVDNMHNLLLLRGMSAGGMPSTAVGCAAKPVSVTEGQWFTLRMRVSGMGPVNLNPVHVETWVNGQPVHDCMDKTAISQTGGVGIFATAVSVVTEFDDIWVTSP